MEPSVADMIQLPISLAGVLGAWRVRWPRWPHGRAMQKQKPAQIHRAGVGDERIILERGVV